MKALRKDKNPKTHIQHLTAGQVCEIVRRSGLTRHDFAADVGCGTSQIFKYQEEGLPPRMNRLVRSNILRRAMEFGIVPETAAARAEIQKLAKGRKQKHQLNEHRETESTEDEADG
ncbi:MAG TPA: hypothetical protein VF585_03830 [Chthoniobacterales bacterium]|jgi:hypothetical protein